MTPAAAAPAAALVAGLAATAGWLALPPRVRPESCGERGREGYRRWPWALAAGVTAVAVGTVVRGTDLVLALLAMAVVLVVGRRVARSREAVRAAGRAEQILLACEAMAGDLGAGLPPQAALSRAAQEWHDLVPVATAAELDADVPVALRGLARVPGCGQLRTVAAAWQVAHHSGSGLASALAEAAAVLRDERRTEQLVSAELAAARATSRMMAALPALVLLLGAGIGGDPVGFLLHTVPGLVCLTVGLLLSWLGVVWLDRIARGVLGR